MSKELEAINETIIHVCDYINRELDNGMSSSDMVTALAKLVSARAVLWKENYHFSDSSLSKE